MPQKTKKNAKRSTRTTAKKANRTRKKTAAPRRAATERTLVASLREEIRDLRAQRGALRKAAAKPPARLQSPPAVSVATPVPTLPLGATPVDRET